MSSSARVMVKTENDSYQELDVKHLAKKCFEQKNYEQAKKFYEFILVTDPEDVQALCNLAKVLFYLQDYSSALRNAAKAINLEPDYDKAYHIAAKVAEKQDNMFMCKEYLKLGLEKCYGAPILKDYYDKVKGMNDAPRTENSSTPAKNSQDGVKKNNNGPKSASNSSFDDCPELITDSESESESDYDFDSEDCDSSEDENIEIQKVKPAIAPVRKTTKPPATTKPTLPTISKQQQQQPPTLSQQAAAAATTPSTENKEKSSSGLHQDEFMKTVINVAKEKKLTYEDVAKNRIQTFKTICKEGSEAFLQGINRKSVEKYKEAYDMIDDMPLDLFKINEEDYAVLKYMISLLKIKSANYENIVSSITVLKEIEEKQARKLPCVYYLLGLAYQTLNRNKFAVEYVEKGLSFLEKDIQFECQPYPQVYEIIPETKKENLQEKLQELINISRTYRQPDAVCRYHQCLSVSNHIIPSRDICYSDPDFTGYVSAICEEHCKICFHLNCWRSWKEGIADGRKVTDKDVLGSVCFTEDCVIDSGIRSIIIQIDIIGTDGQVKSSVKSSVKRDKSVTKKDKRTDSVSEKSTLEVASKEKTRKSEPVNQDKPTPEPVSKEKIEKAPVVKKVKKLMETKPKNKDTKENTGSEEIVKVENDNGTIDLNQKLDRLKKLRKIHFGFNYENVLDPQKVDYGISMDSTQPIDFGIVTPDNELNCQIEFILSMYYDYLKSDGPRKKSEVIKKWDEQKSDLDPNLSVQKNFRGICELLLQSYHFCQVGPYITTSKQVHVAYDLVQKTFEDCKGKPLSESEDLSLDAHLFATIDNNANDVKSHPPDNYWNTQANKKVNEVNGDTNKIDNKTKINTPTKVNKPETKKLVPACSQIETKPTKLVETKAEVKKSMPGFTTLENITKTVETKPEIKKSVPVVSNVETKSTKKIEEKPEIKKSMPKSDSAETKSTKPVEEKPDNQKSSNLDNKSAKPVLTKPSSSKTSVPHSKLSQLISMALDDNKENLSYSSKLKEEKKENTEEEIMNLLYPTANISGEDDGQVENSDPVLNNVVGEISPSNAFLKALKSKTGDKSEGVKKKNINPQENATDIGKDWLCNDVNSNTTSKKNIFNWLKNHDSENDSKSSNSRKVNVKNDFNFPPPKESNDLNKVPKATSSDARSVSNISRPIVLLEKFSQTAKTDTKDLSTQTKPIEEKNSQKDELLREYKEELEEWKEKNKNLELMLVESYNNNAQLMDEIEKVKRKYKKALEEKNAAVEKRNETIKQLKETIDEDKVNEKLDVIEKKNEMIEQLKKAYRKSEKDLMDLRKQVREAKGIKSSESESLLEDLQATEELLLAYLMEYSQLFKQDFTEKAMEKIDALNRTVNYCTDETQPSKNQITTVKKKWEDVQSDINTKLEEFNKQLKEISEKISNGERVKDVRFPSLPSVPDDVFDPIPALLNKLLEDNNKLASIVAQSVPQGLLSLRGCLVDMKRLQGQARPPPPAQTFFPVYQQPTISIPLQLTRPYFGPMLPLQPPRPSPPPPLMSVNRFAAGQSLVYQQRQASPPVVIVPRPARSSSVSSNKSDASVKSTSSSVSETKTENKVQKGSKKADSQKVKPNEENAEKNENKGAKPKVEKTTEKTILKSDIVTSQASPKNDKTSKLKAPTSTLTPVNSINSPVKSSQPSTGKATNTYKLFAYLGKLFPNTTDKELERCLTIIRQNNQGSLVGLDLDTISEKVKEQLKLRTKNTNSLAFVKYSGPAWGTVKEENIDWNKNEQEDYDCVICFEKLTEVNFVRLACKHEFHETCIKKWFKEATTCPTCKRRCLLTDEYPPLV